MPKHDPTISKSMAAEASTRSLAEWLPAVPTFEPPDSTVTIAPAPPPVEPLLADETWQVSWQRIQAKLRNSDGEGFYQQRLKPLQVSPSSVAETVCLTGTLRLSQRQQQMLINKLLPLWQTEHPSITQVILALNAPPMVRAPTQSAHTWDPQLCFDNFVAGESNHFALATAQKVATSKSSPFNPLYLFGGVGLGKTHLLTAIAQERVRLYPEQTVLLMTAERFMREFVAAIRQKENMRFKQTFHAADLLLIDDVHFLANKAKTQEEFFHILNGLIEQRKQVVVASDRPPHDIEQLEPRICSRLAAGLVTEITPPEYDLRRRYLVHRAHSLGLEWDEDVEHFIAENLPVSLRELEGAVTRLGAFHSLLQQPIDVTRCREILRDLLLQPKLRLSMHKIMHTVATFYALEPRRLSESSRQRQIARPRQIAMYLCKQLTPRSLPEIGRQFGGRDHTTVLHALKRIEQLMHQDEAIREDIRQLIRRLQG